ncbi:MAG: D-2-hydroxyacid dehydrogenase [Oscillospiraceae bacterium]|nr:D-2-hydroxyacid dehydrogenase [Oscillospiraceae bacterium]
MKLLITGAWQSAKEQLDALRAMGHEIAFLQQEKDPLPVDPAWVEGVICNGLFLHHPIEAFSALRYIQLTSAGFDRVPMDAVKARGIRIRNARGVYSAPMAEHAVWGVLSLYHQAPFFLKNQAEARWEKHRGLTELAGKTVCILGAGSVGTECAKRFRAFDCRVVGVNRSVRENAAFDAVLPMDALEETLAVSDVVVLTLPLTDATRGLMNAHRLACMKPGAVLVNIARGAVVEEAALIDALQNHLGGAVLDVFESEPLAPESPLWAMENVIVTPHNSFVSDGNAARLNDLILQNLREDADA